MQQNILQLYDKARLQSLEAQEVAWLENQAREHPYFSMIYMVLARHHMTNKSTIKNRALQKGAVYALDRGMLKRYLTDVLPVVKPAPRVPLVTKEVAEPVVAAAAVVAAPETSEAVAPEVVADAAAVPAAEEVAPTTTEETTPNTREAASEHTGINTYLDMRLKLRMEKYKGQLNKLTQELVDRNADGSSEADTPAAKVSQVEPPKTVTESSNGTPTAKKKATRKTATKKTADKPSTRSRKTAGVAAEVEAPVREPVAEPVAPGPESSEYEIGAFSNFTFLEDSEQPDPGESEIDTTMHVGEAVEMQAAGNGPGEIIFEEKERIIEVTVTPEELAKYFKGRLPVELNFSARGSAPSEEAPAEKKTSEIAATETAPINTPPRRQVVREKEAEIIERFIEIEPSISRVSDYQPSGGDLSQTAQQDDADEWVTETLAKIYERQGNKPRAKQIYQKLALIFPEKSDYFADLIAKLK